MWGTKGTSFYSSREIPPSFVELLQSGSQIIWPRRAKGREHWHIVAGTYTTIFGNEIRLLPPRAEYDHRVILERRDAHADVPFGLF